MEERESPMLRVYNLEFVIRYRSTRREVDDGVLLMDV